jgi:hypothetical protein
MKQPSYNIPTEIKAIYCNEHKKENMIDIKNKRCIEDGCMKHPIFNLPTEIKAIYCNEHKKENMIDIKSKRCIQDGCMTRPNYNLPTEIKAIYCNEHKKENMINIKSKRCQYNKCKDNALYGLLNKRPQYCIQHKHDNMINLILENKCNILDCENEFNYIIDNIKYCSNHCPDPKYESSLKRLCRYCDIREETKHVCNDCKKVQNKKEWSIVRYLRKVINTPFEWNSSKMLQGCSKKRPDIYFELNKHCIIVEVDEHQHNTYEDSCECARINEIVNGIGGKSIIIIRYNPDIIKNNGKQINVKQSERIDCLVKIIKEELIKEYDKFIVKIIQLYYNDNYIDYQYIKEEDITNLVCL